MTVATLPQPRVELKRAIAVSGMPAWQVGHLAGLSATVMSHITTGRRTVTRDEASQLARVLEAPLDELFPGEGF